MIAYEKLGIIPEGGLAIFGPQDNSIKDLINKYLIKKNAKGFFYEKDWFIERDNNSIIYRDEGGKLQFELLGLNGGFQIFNAGLCIASLRLLILSWDLFNSLIVSSLTLDFKNLIFLLNE